MTEETKPAAVVPQPISRSQAAPRAAPRPVEQPQMAKPAAEPDRAHVAADAKPRERIPFGSQSSKLAYPKRPGFTRRWFNETPGRIDRALEAGYTHVLNKDRVPVSKGVGVKDQGGGLSGYLMEIPDELYNADFALKQSRMDDTDDTIMRGEFKAQPGDARYGDVKMTRPKRVIKGMGQVGAR